ncbi:MAG: CotH kinase family protein [Kofleriaceae bacterium]
MSRNAALVWAMATVLATACGEPPATTPDAELPDAAAPAVDAGPGYEAADWLFDDTHVLTVELTLAPADWDALRTQSRNVLSVLGEGCGEAPAVSPFTYVPATITIDGATTAQVGLRKKGFLGSLDPIRPSLIVDFDRYVDGQAFSGLRKLTLNNNKQDPGLVDQCLGYQLFAAAGVPAPRCTFAAVSVNGEDLGVYTHVERVEPPMLARHFADASGTLFEGTLSDFRDGWMGTFEPKTNEGAPDVAALERVRAALALADDDAMAAAVEAAVDVDRFLRFWAIETMTAHWDGYAGNDNNFFVYADPTGGKLTFLPWGTDQLFGPGSPGIPG